MRNQRDVPSIPSTGGLDTNTRQVMESVKEILDTREGQRAGDATTRKKRQYVLVSDLITLGLITEADLSKLD